MKTLAVVIGNNNYYDPYKLSNAVNDAVAIKNVFERLRFDVIYGENCLTSDYEKIVSQLDSSLDNYDSSLFYYAGHGFQESGQNYLPAIDCQLADSIEYQLGKHSITLDELFRLYKKHSCGMNIIILDACRRKAVDRGSGDSFAAVSAPKGTLVAFSTSPDSGASDLGIDGHSVYTGTLLEYIGRERLQVEDLFKKVRRSVYERTNGRQVTWEHTSLIGDFYFNNGQMVVSPKIPYKEDVVADSKYNEQSEFGLLISDIRSCNWNKQNPAISKICSMNPMILDANQKFIFGRNLYQASDSAFKAADFINLSPVSIKRYSEPDEQNHLLNGILFEAYFNSKGEFRGRKLKSHDIESILKLRNNNAFSRSFNFIKECLLPYREELIYIPLEDEHVIDFEISAEDCEDKWEGHFQKLKKLQVNGREYIKYILGDDAQSEKDLIKLIATRLCIPEGYVAIHSNIPLRNIHIPYALSGE